MIISNLFRGKFLERPNRFTVIFESNNKVEKAHLRDPGGLKELLMPDVLLLLRPASNITKRKTRYDVIAVLCNDIWVLINSGFHSELAEELINSGLVDEFENYNVEKREYTFGKSRLDFLLTVHEKTSNNNHHKLLEVKGCTLVEEGVARFPDAPTIRGKRHVEELIRAKFEGFNSAILFLIMREDAVIFTPNWNTDPDFSDALVTAGNNDVEVIAYSFRSLLEDDKLIINPFRRIKVKNTL